MPKIIENLEKRLLEEARRQIEELGYSATTIRSVAKGCGVGIGTVYNYFSSKNELLATYMLEDWKECIQTIVAVSNSASHPEPVARCIVEQLQSYVKKHHGIFRDAAAATDFAGASSRYHGLLRSQLAQPLAKFCGSAFASEFIAEALLTWTTAGKSFSELYPLVEKLF